VRLKNDADLIAPARWSTAARGSFDTPAAIVAKGQQLLELTAVVGPEMLDVREIVKTIVNSLEFPNADQIMPEEQEGGQDAQGADDGGMGLPPELLAMAGGQAPPDDGGGVAGLLASLTGGNGVPPGDAGPGDVQGLL
jgi:hypothetical protein